MAVAGDLIVNIGASTQGLKRGLDSSRNMIGGFASKIGPGLAAAGAAAGAALAAGIVAGVGALGVIGAKSLSTFQSLGDSLDKVSARTGVSVEALSQLGFAAEQSGSSSEDLEKGMFGLSRSVFDFSRGSAEARDAFGKLGITFGQLQGLKPEQQLGLIADRMGQFADTSTRGAIAQKIFGRAGRQLLPLLAGGSAGIAALAAEADRLGLTVTTSQAKAAADFADAWNRIKRQGKAALFNIGHALFETFDFKSIMASISSFASTFKTEWLPAIQGVLNTVKLGFDGVAMFIKDTWGALFGSGGDLLGDALFFARNMDLIAKLVLEHFILFGTNAIQLFKNIWNNGFEIFKSLAMGIGRVFVNLFEDLVRNAKEAGKQIWRVLRNPFAGIDISKFGVGDLLRGGAREDLKKVGALLMQGIQSTSPQISALLRQIADREAARLKKKPGLGGDPTKPGAGDVLGGAVKQGPVEGAVRGTSEFFKRLTEIRGGGNAQEKQVILLDKLVTISEGIKQNTKPQAALESFNV